LKIIENIDDDHIFVISMSHFSFPVAQLIIGRLYVNDCPINTNIPHYLVVAGSITLTDIILGILLGVLTVAIVKPAMKAADHDAVGTGLTASICCLMCGITTVLFALAVFVMGWTIAGLIWVFGAWNKVQYVQPNQSNYCHPTLYRFTYWLFILPFILGFVFCCCPLFIGCCAACKGGHKALRQRVPTIEA